MSYEMLKGQAVYVEKQHEGEGYWKDGIHHKGSPTVGYETLQDNFIEPVDRGEVEALPSGIRTKDARWLLTDHPLNTYMENNENASYADKVYLSDPTVGSKKNAYIVYDNEDWSEDCGTEFFSGGFNYLIVKEGKL